MKIHTAIQKLVNSNYHAKFCLLDMWKQIRGMLEFPKRLESKVMDFGM